MNQRRPVPEPPEQPARTTLERIQELQKFALMAKATNDRLAETFYAIDPTTISSDARLFLSAMMDMNSNFSQWLESHAALLGSVVMTIELDD